MEEPLEDYMYEIVKNMNVVYYTNTNLNYNAKEIDRVSKSIKTNKEDEYMIFSSDYLTIYSRNGDIHRVGQPAVIFKNGNCEWVQNGLLHRLDGPALIYPEIKEFWINGVRYKDAMFYKILIIVNRFINILKRKYRMKYITMLQTLGKKTKYISSKISLFII